MWNLLKRFVLTVMRLKMATKLFKKTKTFRALKDKLEQPIVQVFTFLRDNENVSESTRNSCHSSFWIMRAKKGRPQWQPRAAFQTNWWPLCLCGLQLWKTYYKRAASQHFPNKHLTELCTFDYFHVFSVFFYVLHWDVPFSSPKSLALILSMCWSGHY